MPIVDPRAGRHVSDARPHRLGIGEDIMAGDDRAAAGGSRPCSRSAASSSCRRRLVPSRPKIAPGWHSNEMSEIAVIQPRW